MWILKSLRGSLRALLFVLLLGTATFATSAPASAHGQSFDVTEAGIQLQRGTFEPNGHINIKLSNQSTVNVHFEEKCVTATDKSNPECFGTAPNKSSQAQYIGTSFIPWSALGATPASSACVVWVQVGQEQYHYGENGEAPFCGAVPPIKPPVTPAVPSPEEPQPAPSQTPAPTQTPTPGDSNSTPPNPAPGVETPGQAPVSEVPQPTPGQPNNSPATVAPGRNVPTPLPSDPTPADDQGIELASDVVVAGTNDSMITTDLPQGITSEQVNSLGIVTSWKEIDSDLTPTPDIIETEYAATSGLAETGISTPVMLVSAFAIAFLFIGVLTFHIARRPHEN